MNIKNKKDVTVLDYTKELETKVKEIYNNNLLEEKALFLLYLINRGMQIDIEGYQVNVTSHRNILGLQSGKDWVPFFNKLIDAGIIICTTPHIAGTKSRKYIMSKKYYWKKNTGEIKKRFYGEQYNTMNRTMQQFHVDGQVVRLVKESKWSKNYQYIAKEDETNNTSLENRISMLEEMMELMGLKIKEQANEIAELKEKINNNIQPEVEVVVQENVIENKKVEPEKVISIIKNIEEIPTGYDVEIDRYLLANITDAEHIYNNISRKKIECLPTPENLKEAQRIGLRSAIEYKLNKIKQVV